MVKKTPSRLVAIGMSLAFAILACNAPESPSNIPPTPYHAPTTTPRATSPSSDDGDATATVQPTNTPAPTGALVDFENWGSWRRGDQPYGTFEQSQEQVHGGQFAGKLSYDFPSADNDFVVYIQSHPIPGNPDRIQAWVYGDESGHFLNVWIQDAELEVWQSTFGRVTHSGWLQMEAEIALGQDWPWGHISGPSNETVDYPIAFHGLVLDDGEDAFTGSGTLFIDEIDVP